MTDRVLTAEILERTVIGYIQNTPKIPYWSTDRMSLIGEQIIAHAQAIAANAAENDRLRDALSEDITDEERQDLQMKRDQVYLDTLAREIVVVLLAKKGLNVGAKVSSDVMNELSGPDAPDEAEFSYETMKEYYSKQGRAEFL